MNEKGAAHSLQWTRGIIARLNILHMVVHVVPPGTQESDVSNAPTKGHNAGRGLVASWRFSLKALNGSRSFEHDCFCLGDCYVQVVSAPIHLPLHRLVVSQSGYSRVFCVPSLCNGLGQTLWEHRQWPASRRGDFVTELFRFPLTSLAEGVTDALACIQKLKSTLCFDALHSNAPCLRQVTTLSRRHKQQMLKIAPYIL